MILNVNLKYDKMILPLYVYKNDDNEILFEGNGLAKNIDSISYSLQLTPTPQGMFIHYYGEDDSWLKEKEIKRVIKNAMKK